MLTVIMLTVITLTVVIMLTVIMGPKACRGADDWCAARLSDRCALILHLTNHYALIYALREWADDKGTLTRQLLTTRRGQRPTQWIDWAEIRWGLW